MQCFKQEKSIKKGISLSGKATECYINKGVNELNKKFTLSKVQE